MNPTTAIALTDADDSESTLGSAQYDRVINQLPSAHPATMQIIRKFTELSFDYEDLPTGLGGNPAKMSLSNGEFHMLESKIDPTLIYDPGFCLRTTIDEQYENDPEFKLNVHAAMERGFIKVNGAVQQYFFQPVILMERLQDPTNSAGPCYALLKGRLEWKAALNLRTKWIEGLAYPDMPDYHARDTALRLARLNAEPLIWEVIRSLIHMQKDFADGQYAVGAEVDQPPPLTQVEGAWKLDITSIAACSRGYQSQIEQVLNNQRAALYLDTGKINPSAAYTIVSKTKGDAKLCEQLLDQAVETNMSVAQIEAYLKKLRTREVKPRSPEALLGEYTLLIHTTVKNNSAHLAAAFGTDSFTHIQKLTNDLMKAVDAAMRV